MTVKAVCAITNLSRDSDTHTHFVATVRYVGLTDADISGTHYLNDLNPSLSGVTLVTQIESSMKTFLDGEGIDFGLLDTVRLLPEIL